MPYRDRRPSLAPFSVVIGPPDVRRYAAWATGVAIVLVVAPCTIIGALSPLLLGAAAVVGVVLGLSARAGEPSRALPSVRITVDERALAVRVEHAGSAEAGALVSSVPLARDVRVVVTGVREGAVLVEIVELRRGDEKLLELFRQPDSIVQSFLFAPVEREIRDLNAEIQASADRAIGAA